MRGRFGRSVGRYVDVRGTSSRAVMIFFEVLVRDRETAVLKQVDHEFDIS